VLEQIGEQEGQKQFSSTFVSQHQGSQHPFIGTIGEQVFRTPGTRIAMVHDGVPAHLTTQFIALVEGYPSQGSLAVAA